MKSKFGLLSLLFIALGPETSLAALEFDLSALELSEKQSRELDKDVLKNVEQDIPGEYQVDLYVNGNKVQSILLNFEICEKKICPEVSMELLKSIGIRTDYFRDASGIEDKHILLLPSPILPGVKADFDRQALKVNLTVPQVAVSGSARGNIPQDEWDDGIPVAFASFNGSGNYSDRGENDGDSSHYLNITSGANLGPWRLRNQGYYRETSGSKEWRSLQTYLSRDIKALRAQVYAGQYSTSGKTLPGFAFKGMMISSDLNMLPDSLRGFAPTIRGIALTQAKIEIKQKGNVVYQTFVPPGPFEINDLYPTSGGGDLEVTVEESDGTRRTFTQAYAASTLMLRHNQFEYALAGGHYDSSQAGVRKDKFLQAEAMYGVLDSTTLYAGILNADGYRNILAGAAQGLGILGSASLDVQQARSEDTPRGKVNGKAWQAKYNKVFSQTGTSLSASYLKYLNDGFLTFDQYESQNIRSSDMGMTQSSDIKSRQQVTLSQNLYQYGSLNASLFRQDSFVNKKTSQSFNLAYNFNIKGASTSLSWTSTSSSYYNSSRDDVVALNISVPLSIFSTTSNNNFSQINVGTSRSDSGRMQNLVSLSGTALEGNNMSYSVGATQTRGGNGVSDSNSQQANVRYSGTMGRASLGYTQTQGAGRQFNYGYGTSLMVHPYGLTTGQEFAQTNSSAALVRAPGAEGVKVVNKQGVRTDYKGYAIVPNLQSYRYNNIQLDPSTLQENAELGLTQLRKVPTQGAVVLAEYQTQVGTKAYLRITTEGRDLPLGKEVKSTSGASGIVDDQGMAWITGLADEDTIYVPLADRRCEAKFNVSRFKLIDGVLQGELQCK